MVLWRAWDQFIFLYSGLVLKNNEYIEYAKKLFKNSLKNLEGVYSPILCHEYSGLGEIANVFCIQ